LRAGDPEHVGDSHSLGRPLIGATLGRYRIIAKLGEGGMGSVWRAEDPTLGRTVALKILSPALWASDAARQRFLREARAASQLDHPAIATVYDVGETDGHAWIAYRFVDGETVAARCQRGPLPIAEAITIARETATALAHAHARGVLHRDVTAGNVMVTRDGHAVLVDFGLARPEQATQLTSTGALMGTAGYVAPEILKGQAADERSDLYGLGAVLYRMLAERMPFEGGAPEALLYRVLNDAAPPVSEHRPEVSGALERVVARLLEREPANRHANATEVEAALAELSPTQAPTAGELRQRTIARQWRTLARTARRLGGARIGLAGVLILAVVAGAVWFAAQRSWLPGMHHGPPVVAVLPFENTSATPEDFTYLGEGLGDELVLKLGRVAGYRMLPWTTTRAIPNPGRDLVATARRLHADALLVGTFRADSQRVRVIASLVDGRTGVQRWSQTFDELVTDLMAVQSSLAMGVATELRGQLASDEKRVLEGHPTTNPEAYALYLQGANYMNAPDEASQAMAAPFFTKAIEADPHLAEAYVGLGATKLDQYFRGEDAGLDVLESGERDMNKALELQPGIPRALSGLMMAAYLTGRSEDCLRFGAIAAKRGDDDIEGLMIRGRACMLGHIPDVAVPLFDRVITFDPSNREAAWFRVISLTWAQDFPLALKRGKDFIRRFGEDPEIYTWMGASANCLGRKDEAGTYYDRALQLFGDSQSNLYSVLQVIAMRYKTGDRAWALATARRWRDQLRARLSATPDNDRVLGLLTFCEIVLEDRAAVRTRVRQIISLVESPRPDHSEAPALLLPVLCHLGDPELIREVLSAVAKVDLAPWVELLSEPFVPTLYTLGPCPDLEAMPEYKAFLRAVRARSIELRRRYVPVLALKGDTRGVSEVPASSSR